MQKRISILLLTVLLALNYNQVHATNVLSLKKAYDILRPIGKVVEATLPKFIAALKGLPVQKLIPILQQLPKEEHAEFILSLATTKHLMTEADALYAFARLKEFEQKSISLAVQGYPAQVHMLEQYFQGMLTKVAAGDKLKSETIVKHIQLVKNGGLAGTRHYKSLVLFDSEGFPVFDSVFSVELPKHMYKLSDTEQFTYATKRLVDKIEKNPRFAQYCKKLFFPEDIDKMWLGQIPRGYTWYHNRKPGLLELVETTKYQQTTPFISGKGIWGGV